jgi:hypothetical protein
MSNLALGRAVMLAALASGVLAAGCNSGVRSVAQDRGGYSPAEFRYATENKDLLVEISGNPFRRAEAELGAYVEAAMQPQYWGFDQAFTPRTRPTLNPGPSANLDYRIAVAFAGRALEEPALICAEEAPEAPAAAQGPIRARMAFCHRGQLLSTSYGYLEAAEGPADERFLGLISRLTRELFPHREFRDGDQKERRRIG